MTTCRLCGQESDAGICATCWEPVAQYLDAGGSLKEYMRCFMEELARKTVRDLVEKGVTAVVEAAARKADKP